MENRLSPEDKNLLLQIAREAIVSNIETGCTPRLEPPNPVLQEKRGCFVCVKINGKLRGCIGNFISDKPLYQLVQEMAISAATRDPRFYPMKKADLVQFDVHRRVVGRARTGGVVT